MSKLASLIAIAALLTLSTPAAAQQLLSLRAGTLIDGKGGVARNQVIAIEGSRISADCGHNRARHLRPLASHDPSRPDRHARPHRRPFRRERPPCGRHGDAGGKGALRCRYRRHAADGGLHHRAEHRRAVRSRAPRRDRARTVDRPAPPHLVRAAHRRDASRPTRSAPTSARPSPTAPTSSRSSPADPSARAAARLSPTRRSPPPATRPGRKASASGSTPMPPPRCAPQRSPAAPPSRTDFRSPTPRPA